MKKSQLKKVIKGNIKLMLNQGFRTSEGDRMDRLFRVIGYDDFHQFIADNPGCKDLIIDWIDDTFDIEHLDTDADELESVDLHRLADK